MDKTRNRSIDEETHRNETRERKRDDVETGEVETMTLILIIQKKKFPFTVAVATCACAVCVCYECYSFHFKDEIIEIFKLNLSIRCVVECVRCCSCVRETPQKR